MSAGAARAAALAHHRLRLAALDVTASSRHGLPGPPRRHRRRAPAAARPGRPGRELHPGPGAGAGGAVRHRPAHLRRRGGGGRRQRRAVLDPERLQAVLADPGDAPARRGALGADPPRALRQSVQLAAAARERAGHAAQSLHQRRRDRRLRPAAQRPRRRRQGEPARDALRPRRRADRLRRRGRGLGGGHRLSQRRPRQLHEELRQDRQRRRRRARLLLPPVRGAHELPPARAGRRLPVPRRRPSGRPATARRW